MDESLREFVRQRAAQRCEYCCLPQSALPWAKFHVEHIRARQHRGDDDLDNLALACGRCNLYKGPNLSSVDPQTNQLVHLFHPRHDDWSDHFELITHQVIGLTAVGRATAALLQMNAQDRVQLRAELAALDRNE